MFISLIVQNIAYFMKRHDEDHILKEEEEEENTSPPRQGLMKDTSIKLLDSKEGPQQIGENRSW